MYPSSTRAWKLLSEHAWCRVGDDEVQGVVDDSFPLGTPLIFGHRFAQRPALDLANEGNEGCRAAAGGGNRRRVEVGSWPRSRFGGILLDVDMRIDPARQHELACGIDFPVGRRKVSAQQGNCSILDADFHRRCIGGSHDNRISDYEIQFTHCSPLRVSTDAPSGVGGMNRCSGDGSNQPRSCGDDGMIRISAGTRSLPTSVPLVRSDIVEHQ